MDAGFEYQAEYAKSGRSSCRSCKNTIAKDALRIGVFVQSHTFDGKMILWHHCGCFFKKSQVLQTSAIKNFDKLRISGFSKLKVQEKFDLLDAIKNVELPSVKRGSYGSEKSENRLPTKKSKLPTGEKESSKYALKASFRKQSNKLWRLREQLDAEVSTSALVGLLESNSQLVPSGRAALLDAVADAMLFGALPHCPLDSAPLVCVDGGYRCSRLADHWAPCLFSATATDAASLARSPFHVPEEYHDVPFLRTYKCKPRVRLFTESSSASTGLFDKRTPLAGLHFLLDRGSFSDDATERHLAASIRSLGGSLLDTVSDCLCSFGLHEGCIFRLKCSVRLSLIMKQTVA
ncbi:unnamed protein product [Hydatigera taeniaeformis]|uniref:PARP-type domain-containing protein n=1 Tax=Hydatigena taeniaeformis TaxID=6205 RepID=A0A0R3WU02_HYDTA|nr:unnamed protein product [Hydatigera taeniaeformis]